MVSDVVYSVCVYVRGTRSLYWECLFVCLLVCMCIYIHFPIHIFRCIITEPISNRSTLHDECETREKMKTVFSRWVDFNVHVWPTHPSPLHFLCVCVCPSIHHQIQLQIQYALLAGLLAYFLFFSCFPFASFTQRNDFHSHYRFLFKFSFFLRVCLFSFFPSFVRSFFFLFQFSLFVILGYFGFVLFWFLAVLRLFCCCWYCCYCCCFKFGFGTVVFLVCFAHWIFFYCSILCWCFHIAWFSSSSPPPPPLPSSSSSSSASSLSRKCIHNWQIEFRTNIDVNVNAMCVCVWAYERMSAWEWLPPFARTIATYKIYMNVCILRMCMDVNVYELWITFALPFLPTHSCVFSASSPTPESPLRNACTFWFERSLSLIISFVYLLHFFSYFWIASLLLTVLMFFFYPRSLLANTTTATTKTTTS